MDTMKDKKLNPKALLTLSLKHRKCVFVWIQAGESLNPVLLMNGINL